MREEDDIAVENLLFESVSLSLIVHSDLLSRISKFGFLAHSRESTHLSDTDWDFSIGLMSSC